MKKSLLLLCALLPLLLAAQEAADGVDHTVAIREIPVWGRRPMKEIGTTQHRFDSVVLRENIALSIADVLAFNSPLFVKQYGRATLSTVSFRGTGPSHTQVTWNGMRLNNPMLGMTDFSMIPAYFIDRAQLLHGSSSVGETGGALGGVVKLATAPDAVEGFGLQYIQGVGMFHTFDEYLRLQWGDEHWQLSTRAVYQSSRNDFPFRNRDKKENIYDDQMQIVGSYHPRERNRNGAFHDLHLLQEAYYNTRRGDRFGLSAWYIASNREIPLLTTDYVDITGYENRQREESFRGLLSWEHLRRDWRLGARAGYTHTWMGYDYRRDTGNGHLANLTRSRSRIHTLYAEVEGEYALGEQWLFTADLTLHHHLVRSADKEVEGQTPQGYDEGRTEFDASLSAKWRPAERWGLSAVVRQAVYGSRNAVTAALMADYLLSRRGNVVAKGSISRNHRFPSLNDLYFLPGGNPALRDESGYQYEAGLSFAVARKGRYSLSGSATWYDQRIDDWILWLPTVKGFFSPTNIRRVHAYGVEVQASFSVIPAREWKLSLDGNFSWAPAINEGERRSPADRSVGKQLPYEPEFSATATGHLTWRRWTLMYQWCWYSKRYTMSSNASSLTGSLPPYYMNNLSLERLFSWRWADLSLKGSVNNLFDSEYLSVLARPMPGIHAEFFIGIRPKWGKRRN